MENAEIIKLLEGMKTTIEGCKQWERKSLHDFRNGQINILERLIKTLSDEEKLKEQLWIYTVDHKGELK